MSETLKIHIRTLADFLSGQVLHYTFGCGHLEIVLGVNI